MQTPKQFEKSLVIFTDGSSLGNPGSGGWGSIIISTQLSEIVELGGMKSLTTNNEMELTAVVSALSYSINNTEKVHIFTDSQYVINGITNWVYTWSKNGWKTKNGEEVKNIFLWKTLFDLVENRGKENITWNHVPGHVGVPGNERVDDIAREFAEGKNVLLYRGNNTHYNIQNILSFELDTQEQMKKERKGKKAYSYLSVIGGVLKKHSTWELCEQCVKGKSAKFKKSLSKEHEEEIIQEWKDQKIIK